MEKFEKFKPTDYGIIDFKYPILLPALKNSQKKKLYIASDHGGFELKEYIKDLAIKRGYEYVKSDSEHLEFSDDGHYVIDIGTHSDERCDYPIYGFELGQKISEDPGNSCGVAICKSGNGIGNSLNINPGVISSNGLTAEDIETNIIHNRSNVLVLPASVVDKNKASVLFDSFLDFELDLRGINEAYLRRHLIQIMNEYKIVGKGRHPLVQDD
ncbi:hypothetical protein BVX95_00745 [archaeon D22]|nr:hypothetical protein BVX95_00745 [archaeon D22]